MDEGRLAEPGSAETDADVLTLGPLTLSRQRREVRLDGEEVALTPKELDLLCYLMERAGTVVSRDALLAEVWGFLAQGETRTVEVHVGHVRKKLGDPSLIRTVRGIGYMAVAR
jgi:two-component system, OmpR family, alkaline phosphatase synthesis response regulator PhoP